MLALRQEAIELLNELPENLLAEVVKNLRDLKNKIKNFTTEKTNSQKKFIEGHSFTEEDWQKFLNSGSGTDPKKAAAFSRLEELRKNNSVLFSPDTDWKKEIAEAACEKYGYFN